MSRKIFKHIWLVAMLILTAGMVLFLPSFVNSSTYKEAQLQNNRTSNIWMDENVAGNATDSDIQSGGAFYGNTNVYFIYSAVGLANVAYNVNSNQEGYATATYVLANDIDLDGAFWTPIGTSTNPFKGVFLGEGHTISNLSIDTYFVDTNATSGRGLFGNIEDSTISDLIISGDYTYTGTSSLHTGNLVGRAINSTIIACRDEMNSSYTSVGTTSGTVQVFSSSAYATTSVVRGSIVEANIVETGVLGEIDGTGVTQEGYALFYNNTNTTFYINDMPLADGGGSRLRVLVDTNFEDFSDTLIRENPMYYTHKAILRESLNLTDTEIPYSLRPGYRPQYEESMTTTNCSVDITFESVRTRVVFDMGYGSREVYALVPYDTTLNDFFNSEEGEGYNLRLGYGSMSILTERGNIDNNPDFYYAYPYGDVTITWVPYTNRSFNFRFLLDNTDYQIGGFDYGDVVGALTNTSGEAGSHPEVTGGTLDSDRFNDTGIYTVNNIISDDDRRNNEVTISFMLAVGYEIAVAGNGSSLVINDDDENNIYSSNSNYVYQTENGNYPTSGVYLNFSEFTGEDGDPYTTTNRNNDSYNQVIATGTVRNESGSGEIISRQRRIYTITISNLVGTTGDIYFVVRRVSQDITVQTNVSALSEADYNSFTWYYGDGLTTQDAEFTVGARLGETINLRVLVSDESGYYVLSHNTNSSSIIFTGTGSGNNLTVNGTTYYREMTFTATINNLNGDLTLTVGIGGLNARFQFEVGTLNGDEFSAFDGQDDMQVGISGNVNNTDVGLGAINFAPVRDSNGNNPDAISITTNGYYSPTTMLVYRRNLNTNEYECILTAYNVANSFTKNGNTYTWSPLSATENIFDIIYDGTYDGVDFIVRFIVEEASYTLGWENFVFDIIDDNVNHRYLGDDHRNFLENLFELSFSDTEFVYGQQGTVTLTLTELGLQILYGNVDNFTPQSINNSLGTSGNGFQAIVVNSTNASRANEGEWEFTFTAGTYDFEFHFEFTYKKINISAIGIVNSSYQVLEITDDIFIGNNGTYQYEYSNGQVILNGNSFGSIQLHTQYYLLGWYLQNGNVVAQSNYNDIYQSNSLISEYLALTSGQNNSTFNINVYAIVELRSVNVSYNAGEEGKGEITTDDSYDTLIDILTYGEQITLKSPFRNKGYLFDVWTYLIGEREITAEEGNFSITGTNWSNLFGNTSFENMESWSSFSDANNNGQPTSRHADLELTATWTIINYNILIDNSISRTNALQIGDEIRFLPSGLQDGGGTYFIYRNGVAISEIGSGTMSGFDSIGFTVSFNDRSESSQIDEGEYASIIFDGLIYDSLLGDEFDSDETIRQFLRIDTDRDGSAYLVYIENSEYFDVVILEEGDYYGQDSNGVYVIVAYESIPTMFDKNSEDFLFGEGGAIQISRNGYQFSGDFYNFDPTEQYLYTRNITISPIWTKIDEQTASGNIEFKEDIDEQNPTFYLLNSHDITVGSINDFNLDLDQTADDEIVYFDEIGTILSNGEQIVSFGFVVEFNGNRTTYQNITEFNINNLYESGNYTIYFYIELGDSLYNTSDSTYQVISQSLTFTMNKNDLEFTGNFVSAYNGTSEFVPTTSAEGYSNVNDYGNVFIRYSWDGSELDENSSELYSVASMFRNYLIGGNDFSVGNNKDFILTINNSYFSIINSINGVSVNSSTNWANLIENITDNSGSYSYNYQNGATIVRTRFVIDFGQRSMYYFDNETLVVYAHDGSNQTFQIGRVYFEWNLNQIIYIGESVTDDTTFTGEENGDVFDIVGLTINGNQYENNMEDYFEYVLEGEFTLLDPSSALKLNYSTRYFTATSGQLNDTLDEIYDGQTDILYIGNVIANGENVEINDSQYTHQVNGQVLFTIINNNSNNLIIYINRSMLGYGLSFNIYIDLSNSRASHLTPLSWGTSTNVNDYESDLDSNFSDSSQGDPYNEYVISSAMEDTSYFAVLTDIVKLTINYNGGVNENNEGSQLIYLSYSDGPYQLANPTIDYNGIDFDRYSYLSNNITISYQDNNASISNIDGGQPVSLTAYWLLTDIDFNIENDEFDFLASLSSIELNIDEIISYASLNGGTYSFVLSKNGDEELIFNAVDGEFVIADSNGRVPTTLSGEYTLTITLTYSNVSQGQQAISRDVNINLSISLNEVGIEKVDQTLTFNNGDRKEDIMLGVRLNGELVGGNTTLSNLIAIGNASYGLNTIIRYNSQNVEDIVNAGVYTVTITLDSNYSNFFSIENGYNEISIEIGKYQFNLADYSSQISISKLIGTEDPNPITDTITITDNLFVSDQLEINFTRESGEEIGEYDYLSAVLANSTDLNNYNMIFDGIDSKFVIGLPDSDLLIELDGTLTYIYNGYALSSISVRVNSEDGNLELYGMAGDEEVSQSFRLYYSVGGSEIEIPIDQGRIYSAYLNFEINRNISDNVGSYSFSVSLSDEGESAGWNGVNFAQNTVNNQYNNIVVTKRTITISSASKVFDQSNLFTFSNDETEQSVDFVIGNIVDGDVISISGQTSSELVGQQQIINIQLDEISNANYILENSQTMTITPSQENVSASTDTYLLAYGNLFDGMELSRLLSLITVSFEGQENTVISNSYITISNYQFTYSSFSTGEYLEVGRRGIQIILTSSNYTFGQEVGEIGQSYTTVVNFDIQITPISITINNSSHSISKVYDGDNLLDESDINHSVNANLSPYISSGLLNGDVITIVSGNYIDAEWGTNKQITNLVFAENDDSSNYLISYPNLVGSITDTELVFNKDYNTYDFVQDGQGFSNTQSISLPYSGNVDELINTLLNESYFVTRQGYTQTGWLYNGETLSTNMSGKEEFLQDAVDSGLSGVTLQVIWQINTYQITIEVNNSKIAPSTTTIYVEYYSSLNSQPIEVTANEGYTFEGVVLSSENGIVSQEANSTNVGSFNVTNITGDMTISIVTEEIEIRIILDYNNPEGISVSTDTDNWINTTNRVMTYSQLSQENLPTIDVDQPNSYDFDYWTINEEISDQTNIWERIKEYLGYAPLQDDLTGYTFVAHWIEEDITLTIENSGNATITVYRDSISNKNIVEGQDGVYNVKYNENLIIDIQGDDWYKWSGLELGQEYANLFGDTTPTLSTDGRFSLQIKGMLNISISMEEIEITINTTYTTPLESSVNESEGEISGVYTISDGQISIEQLIDIYTATVGTYNQVGWQNGEKQYLLSQTTQEIIIDLLGAVPTTDTIITLNAVWQGVTYSISFVKNNDDAIWQDNIEEGEESQETIVREYVYGEIITNLPIPYIYGMNYTWLNEFNESIDIGQYFTTAHPNTEQQMTFTANWDRLIFNISVIYDGVTNSDKINSVIYGYTGQDYISGGTGNETAVYGQNRDFIFNLDEGYEIDLENTIIDNPDNVSLIYYDNSSTLRLGNIVGDVVVTISIKAKDYVLTIEESQYEDISQTSFDVSYDQNVSSLFNGVTFEREGYTIAYLYSGNEIFASYTNGVWQFSEDYVQNNLYKTDSNLTLKPIYQSNNNYINQISTTATSGLIFNGDLQQLASTAIQTLNNETSLAINNTLLNGDVVIDFYYTLNGQRIESQSNLELFYRDAVINGVLSFTIVLRDSLSLDGNATYTYVGSTISVNLARSNILTSGSNLASYYSGTMSFYPSEENIYGYLTYSGGNTINELVLNYIEFVDDTDLYNVGEGYSIIYYLSVNGDSGANFNANNYNNLRRVPNSNVYSYTVSDVTADIVPATITFTFDEQGFYNGNTQSVTGEVGITLQEWNVNFDVILRSITTLSEEIGLYQTADQFEIDFDVELNGVDKKENFIFTIVGGYEIVDLDNTYQINANVQYLNVEEQTVSDLTAYNLTINSFTFENESMTIDGQSYNFMVDGQLVFSLTGNGSNSLKIIVSQDVEVTFDFMVDGEMDILCWTDSSVYSDLLRILNSLSSLPSNSFSQTFSEESQLNVVFTDYKAILMSLGDQGSNQGYLYVKAGNTVVATEPDWTGFEFVSWRSQDSMIECDGNEITISENADITSSMITAIWEIAIPEADVTVENDTIIRSAKAEYGALTDGISVDNVTGTGVTNINTTDIDYTYTWLKDGEIYAQGESFSVPANTSSNGQYILRITASREGYVSQSINLTFTISITRIDIGQISLNETEFTYANTDHSSSIIVNFENIGEVNLDQILNAQNTSNYYFTLSGISNQYLRDAGQYTLTLGLNENVFNDISFSTNIDILAYGYTITMEDIPESLQSKIFGSQDPEFVFNLTMFEDTNSEVVSVLLTREEGENVGQYDFTSVHSENSNYNFTLSDCVFSINQSGYVLEVIIDSPLTMTYNGSAPTFTTRYDAENGRWMISTGESESSLTLYILDDGNRTNISSWLYSLALENITISYPSAINAGNYDLENLVFTFGQNSNFDDAVSSGQLTIERRALTISSVTKVFDRNNDIVSSGVEFINLVQNDDVILTGEYSSVIVGNNIALNNLSLSGDDSANYYIENSNVLGSITPLQISQQSLVLTNTDVVYGQIGQNTSLDSLLSIVGDIVLTLDGITTDLENGFISFTGFTVKNQYLSSSNYLIATNVPINITLSSQNFTFDGENNVSFIVELNVSPKSIDLSGLSNLIVKDYDGTDDLPEGFNSDISAYGVISGDNVYIDTQASHYDNEMIAQNKEVTIILAGVDEGNYSVVNNVRGTINAYTIYFMVDADTEDPLLVTDGEFVDDGQSPVVRDTFFILSFPNEYDGEQLISQLTYPTRVGYHAVGWMILQGEEYIQLTSQNINQIIENIVNDAENTEKTITIYTMWEIDYYEVIVNGQNINDYVISGQYYESDTNLVRYYSSIEISVSAVVGYKISRYTINGTYGSADLEDVGQNSGVITIDTIQSAIELIVNMEEIQVSFIIDANLPNYTSRIDNESTYLTYSYSSLADIYESDLPVLRVMQGTYSLTGYQYGSGINIGEMSLQEIVDSLFDDLNEDVEITLFAQWQGENYTIYFDAGEGEIVGNEFINAVYGSEIDSDLPSAVLPGRNYQWVDNDGIIYQRGDIFHTIGSLDDDTWTVTLYADYINNSYSLTINYGNRIEVLVNGQIVESGDSFTVIYGEEILSLVVNADQGYDFVIDDQSLNGEYDITSTGIDVYNLIDNGTINISSTPGTNEMLITGEFIDDYQVFIDNILQEISEEDIYSVFTESSVRLVFTASKGYEFNNTSLTYISNTFSDIEQTISQDRKTLTVVWGNFVDDIEFVVEALPSLNTITIGDISDRFISIEFNGESVDVTGGTYSIRSDVDLIVTATLRYGYMDGQATSTIEEFIVSQSCEYDRSDGNYHLTVNIDNINDNFTLSFTSTERTYNFILQVAEGQEGYGQITTEINQTVSFGGELDLGAMNILDAYIFERWMVGDVVIAEDAETRLLINSSLRNILESEEPSQSIVINAVFRERLSDITFISGSHGQLSFYQADSEPTIVHGGQSLTSSLRLGENVYILIEPDDGYEIEQIFVNGEETTDGYDAETGILTLMFDPNSPITSIEVTFTASDAYVHVQGVLQLNYEFIYGTDVGGYVYLVDSQGNRLGDEYYLNGQDSMYYDYDVLSKTDDVIYIMVEANSGFSIVVNSPTTGVVVGSYTTVSGETVYVVSGIRDGAEIHAIFVAEENQVNIQFVTDDSFDVVDGGLISVDTSSIFIRASQNNSENVHVSVVTGETLSIDIYSQFTYDLVEENGQLKVQIDYDDGTFDEGAVSIGSVSESDPYENGFTKHSTLNITNVNADATIYIYVQPKIYNIVFYVTDDIQVSLPNAVIYGQTLSLSSLTDEQRAQVFSTREGYSLDGYYTVQTGRGTKYIDGDGIVLSEWKETGYEWTGFGYEETANYDAETQTFTLYASWIYNRAMISISFMPEGFEDSLYYATIENVITNLGDTRYWIGQDDLWYVEVSAESILRFQALEYTGYEFINWLVSYNGQAETVYPANFDMTFDTGNYQIRAVYQPRFNISCTTGGNADLIQNGEVVTGESFSTESLVTLRAQANDGYNFIHFVNTDTDEIYEGQYDEATNSYLYTFDQLIVSPLNIRAVFEGKPVTIDLDYSGIVGIHSIVGVYINGQAVDYNSQINAIIGQTFRIIINTSYGYDVTINSDMFTLSTNQVGYNIYTTTLVAENLTENGESYHLDLTLGYSRQSIKLTFEMQVVDAVNNGEIYRAGSLSFVDVRGNTYNADSGSTYQVIYGDTVYLRVYVLANYQLSDILIFDGQYDVSVLSWLDDDNQLAISQSFMDRYEQYNLTIRVIYSRLLWTDDDARANSLLGGGTDSNPYLISSERELAFVAYAVNAGLVNETNGIKYSEAVYQVIGDIDLTGRFWVPIGTHENPFNGTMHLGSAEITGLTLYRNYTNPETSYGGLFWVLGSNARITQDTSTLTIVLCIVIGFIILLLLLLLLVILIRKRRKKRMDEIANN